MNHIKVFIILLSLISLSIVLVTRTYADSSLNTLQAHKNVIPGEYVRKHFLKLMKKPFDLTDQTSAKTRILIIGDSHAQDFLNSIVENKLFSDSQIRTRYIPTRCQIFLGAKSSRKWIKEDLNLCNKSDSLELAKAQIDRADVIILAALWRKWAVIQLPQTINNLNISPNQKIFVIGRRSFSSIKKETVQGLSDKELRSLRKEVDIHQLEINKLMSEALDKHVFINVHKFVCGTGPDCPVFTNRLKMISFDGGHLSQDGARYLGGILFEKSQLSQLVIRDN